LDESGAVVANGLCPSPQPAITQNCRAMPVPANPAFNGSIDPPVEKPCVKMTDIGGRIVGFVNTDTQYFQWGSPADNYWGSGGSRKAIKRQRICVRFPGYLSIYIKDVKDVEVFEIRGRVWDDIQTLAINGKFVYTTDGRMGYYGEAGFRVHMQGCEGGTNFSNWSRVDLKRYLQNGYNYFQIDHFVAGGGEGYIGGVIRLKPGVDNDTSCQ